MSGSSESLRSRMVSIRVHCATLDPGLVVDFVLSKWPESAVVWAVHDEEGKERHAHIMVRFPNTLRWCILREWLMDHDTQSYSRPAGSWIRGVRYLLHLDNPEKDPIPRSALDFRGIDESELSAIIGSPAKNVLESVLQCVGMSPVDAFDHLVRVRGHKPAECTSAINLLYALDRFKRIRNGLHSTRPEPIVSESPIVDDVGTVFGGDASKWVEDVEQLGFPDSFYE